MLNGKVLGGGDDEEVDSIQVGLGALGKAISLANQAANPFPQGSEPMFHMVGFAFVLAAGAVGVNGEGRRIGFSVVVAGVAVLLVPRQSRL